MKMQMWKTALTTWIIVVASMYAHANAPHRMHQLHACHLIQFQVAHRLSSYRVSYPMYEIFTIVEMYAGWIKVSTCHVCNVLAFGYQLRVKAICHFFLSKLN